MNGADEQIVKLQHSLSHWQKWEAEYEALKDEIDHAEECTAKDLVSDDRVHFLETVIAYH